MNNQPFRRLCISAARGKPLETAVVTQAASTGIKPVVNQSHVAARHAVALAKAGATFTVRRTAPPAPVEPQYSADIFRSDAEGRTDRDGRHGDTSAARDDVSGGS